MANGKAGRRVAIVAGLRTPFARANGVFGKLTGLELGRIVVSELIARTGLDRKSVDLLTFGQVIPSVSAPNIAREIVLSTALPQQVDAWSVSRACATSIQSTTDAANQIALGNAEIAIAGGAECLSDIPFVVSRNLGDALVSASRAKDLPSKLRSFAHLSARDLMPIAPALKEPSTGLTMGESAEKMARENGISREEQDRFAKRSHDLAAKAWMEGKFADEVMHVLVPPKYEQAATEDDYVRKDTTLEKLGSLKPVFDRKYGSITAGSSSGLTDGASALVLMSEEKAKALGHEPLGYIRSYSYAAVNPQEQMLIGPAYSIPVALERAGLTLQDMDLVEIHEAFAAVVLSILQKLSSKKFAEEKLGRSQPVGEVDDAKLNVNGGAIALGHPFGATGARMIMTTLNELKRRDRNLGLIGICAAGGLAASVVLERA
ncbi:acetyl-CoA C-acyltransferase FadI [Vulgatibacter incomptus]|uniref:3-ketoacyl-CoA thiolase n=1 Tax=Vulgatibacter incomptus TaxID=1391653 RepID=A0A0K1PFS0_9BACT|nr:acetyl-CoA C-acyltransferase FadI [Vulgatibacter incomptus]AKU92365.1 3-ketoacyl-CoA thiolase [Vulgatibacter incomptus]